MGSDQPPVRSIAADVRSGSPGELERATVSRRGEALFTALSQPRLVAAASDKLEKCRSNGSRDSQAQGCPYGFSITQPFLGP